MYGSKRKGQESQSCLEDDRALVADSREKLLNFVTEFGYEV